MGGSSKWKKVPVKCVVCGVFFIRKAHWGERLCSRDCSRKQHTFLHARYVERNKERIRQYAASWKYKVWGKSNKDVAKRAEEIAANGILPGLGLSRVVHVSKLRRLVPFDIVGMTNGERVLVDVTTSYCKSGPYYKTAVSLANALGMKLFVLFVKPDLSQFAMKPASKARGAYCSTRDLQAIVPNKLGGNGLVGATTAVSDRSQEP